MNEESGSREAPALFGLMTCRLAYGKKNKT